MVLGGFGGHGFGPSFGDQMGGNPSLYGWRPCAWHPASCLGAIHRAFRVRNDSCRVNHNSNRALLSDLDCQ